MGTVAERLGAAGVLALIGRKQNDRGIPPVPHEVIANIKQDIATVSGHRQRKGTPMSDKNVPAGANELRAGVEQPRREHSGAVESPADEANGPGRVSPAAREGVDTVKQTGTRAKKAAAAATGKATDTVDNAASKAGQKADEAGVVAEKVGVVAEQAGAAREKASAVAGQVSEKATVIAGQVGEKAGVVATQVGVTVIEAVEGLPEPVQQRVEQGVRQARRHPAVVAAGTAAVVLLLWKLLRRGR